SGSAAAAAGREARAWDGVDRGTAAGVQPAGLEVRGAVAQHDSRGGGCSGVECRGAGAPGQAGDEGAEPGAAGCGAGMSEAQGWLGGLRPTLRKCAKDGAPGMVLA